jgi:hydroxypyruvate isomerase
MSLRQSFAWWSFRMTKNARDDRQLLQDAAAIGVRGVEMLPAELYPVARDAGLELVAMTGYDIDVGFNDRSHHAAVGDRVRRAIEHAHAEGVGAVIVFAGRREGRSEVEGLSNTIEGLAPLADEAKAAGVTLLLELLNSKVDHPDQQCDHSAFGFAVARAIASPGLRVLYDCYHMQLMEGDLINTIKANLDLIGHVHTAGVPGRRELDDRQEINWRAIAGLLRLKQYAGWVGHEFVPRGDPIETLREAFAQFSHV